MAPLELYPPRFRLTNTAIPGQLLTADQYGIGSWQDPPEGTIPPTTGGGIGDYPRLATIYSKTDINDESGKLAIAKFPFYVTDFRWWPDLGWSGGSGPLGISVGEFIKLHQPAGSKNIIYWHSCLYELFDFSGSLIGMAEPGSNYWPDASHNMTAFYVGGVRYRICLEWFLCYRGSTLSSGINSSTTTIPVTELSYFSVGDYAIIGLPGQTMEMVKITAKSASSGAGNLTVTRGLNAQNTNNAGSVGGGYPAASHVSGRAIRTVAHAFGFPGDMMLNITSTCPTANGGFGSQTYNQWKASYLAMKLAEPHFTNLDGVFLDNVLPFATAIFSDPPGIASIDINNTNSATGVTNSQWLAGEVDGASKLRTALGPSAIILGNTGGAAADFGAYLNGGMIEGLGVDGTNALWSYIDTSAFQGYHNWSAVANPYTIMNGTAGDVVPADRQYNYQAMRFELGWTLLGDGWFAYDEFGYSGLDGGGHQTTWWYDEYDNAGAGIGWLGQPTGAYETISAGVYRRKFANGVVVVNTTGSTVSNIPLAGTYRRISGTQDATANDGATGVTTQTLVAHDARILRV